MPDPTGPRDSAHPAVPDAVDPDVGDLLGPAVEGGTEGLVGDLLLGEASIADAGPAGTRLGSLRARVSTLEFDTAVLLGANATNLALGFLFWFLAARAFDGDVVGRATTLVVTAGSIASFANLGLGPLIERFIPVSGRDASRYLLIAHAISVVTTTAVGVAFVLVDPVADLFTGPGDVVLFVALGTVTAAFALQDSELVSLGAARTAAAQNVAFAVSKLVLLVALLSAATAAAIVGAWLVPAIVAVVVVAWLVAAGRAGIQHDLAGEEPRLPPRRSIATYWGHVVGWLLAASIPGLIVPLLVANREGLTDAAYFNTAWIVLSASSAVMTFAMSPYVAAASRPDADVARRTREFVRFMVGFGLARGAGVALFGSVALRAYGPEYFDAALPLMLVMAVVHTMSIPAYIYGALAKLYRRIAHPMTVQIVGSVIVVGTAGPLLDRFGLVGIGYAYLAQEVAVLVLACAPFFRLLGRARRGEHPDGASVTPA